MIPYAPFCAFNYPNRAKCYKRFLKTFNYNSANYALISVFEFQRFFSKLH